MMLRLSRQTVRHSWQPYAGAFVALGTGVVLIAMAVTLVGAVDVTTRATGVTAEQRVQLDGLSSMFGIMSGVALFMAVFVVASTFGFVVAARRRELGLLRLVGATPRQVRRMVLGESAVVALLASVVGCALATVVTPAFVALLHALGVMDVDLQMPAPWLAWAVSVPLGGGVALVGSWRASKRAARVPPVAVLREAGVERRRPGVWQALIGGTCLAGVVVVIVLAERINPLFALVTAVLLPEVVVIGLICFGGLVFPALAGLLARPFASRNVAARLARDHARASARMTAALAAPIVAISAIAGSMIVAVSFAVDWTTAMDRAQLGTPYVVEIGGDEAAVTALTGADDLALVDLRTTMPAGIGEEPVTDPVETVDVADIARSRGLRALDGDLAALNGEGIAVTETYALDQGMDVGERLRLRLGDRTLHPRVGAIVPDAPDLYADVLVPRSLVGDRGAGVAPELAFVDPGGGDLEAALAGTSARVLTADEWIQEVDARNRAANSLGLWVLLGPSGLYAGIAIVNAVLVGLAQRRRQLRTVALIGATRGQLRRMAVWEAGLVGGGALVAGTAVTGFVGWLVRRAVTADLAEVGMTVPWTPLLAIVGTCVGLTLIAALAGARRVATP